MKKTFIIALIVILAGCSSTKRITPSQTDSDKIASKSPEYTLNELDQGKSLFEQHCALCHKLKNPTSYTEAEWNKIVPQMCAKVNKKEGNVLDAGAQESILKYVVAMSSASSSK